MDSDGGVVSGVANMRARYLRIPFGEDSCPAGSKRKSTVCSYEWLSLHYGAVPLGEDKNHKTTKKKKSHTFASFRSKLSSILIKNGLDETGQTFAKMKSASRNRLRAAVW